MGIVVHFHNASPPIAQMAQCVMKRVRLHGLDLSTKHVADDSREA